MATLADPSNVTPAMVRAVFSRVAVAALPFSAAVMVAAAKFPEASRATTVAPVFVAAGPIPSSVSASNPDPVPSTVTSFARTSAAV